MELNRDIIIERLQEFLEQGRLTGDDIAFDGQPIAAEADSEYRPDGYSHETSMGCRRHRLVDQLRAEYAEGNEREREVAAEFPRWFAFDPERYPDLSAEDEDEAALASRAAYLARIRARWVMGSIPETIYPADFIVSDDDGRQVHATHAVVFGNNHDEPLPERWPQRAVQLMDHQAHHDQTRFPGAS